MTTKKRTSEPRANARLAELCNELLHELYAVSTPPLDFKRFLKEVEKTKKCPKDWFMKHVLEEAKQSAIIEAFKMTHHISEQEWRKMGAVYLDFGPTSVVEEDRIGVVELRETPEDRKLCKMCGAPISKDDKVCIICHPRKKLTWHHEGRKGAPR